MRRREFITLLCGAVSLFLCGSAAAQEGYYGVGHDKWHQGFYSTLKRNDGGGSCCNLMDCRPTQSRIVGDHYEVKVDGAWTPVPYDKINNVIAPDDAESLRNKLASARASSERSSSLSSGLLGRNWDKPMGQSCSQWSPQADSCHRE